MHVDITKTIKLPNNSQYHSLNDLADIPLGESTIITNVTGSQLRVLQYYAGQESEIGPIDGFPIWPHGTALVHGNNNHPIYLRGGVDGHIIVQKLTATVIPFTGVELPQDIVTSGIEGFRRLQVDNSQTGFFEAREFRMVRKIRIAVGEKQIFKFTSPIDFILASQFFSISAGNFEMHAWRDDNVTETTPFSTPVPTFNKNGSSEFRDYDGDRYQQQVTVTTGGEITVTDTNLYSDYAELITAGATAQRTSVTAPASTQRYLAPRSYYLEFTAIGNNAVRGVYEITWEERPEGVK